MAFTQPSSAASSPSAAATILSDFGAEVIKLEPPGAGDPWRASAAVPGKTTDYWWQLTARNKRSLAIDLKHAEGLRVLQRLIATTDVFITNFPLPVRDPRRIATNIIQAPTLVADVQYVDVPLPRRR